MKKIIMIMICGCAIALLMQRDAQADVKAKAKAAWEKTKQGAKKIKEVLTSEETQARIKRTGQTAAQAALEGGINAIFEGGDIASSAQESAQSALAGDIVAQAKEETVEQAAKHGGETGAAVATLAIAVGEGQYAGYQQKKAADEARQKALEKRQAAVAQKGMSDLVQSGGMPEAPVRTPDMTDEQWKREVELHQAAVAHKTMVLATETKAQKEAMRRAGEREVERQERESANVEGRAARAAHKEMMEKEAAQQLAVKEAESKVAGSAHQEMVQGAQAKEAEARTAAQAHEEMMRLEAEQKRRTGN